MITACWEKSPEWPSENPVEDDRDVVSEEKTSAIPTPVEVSLSLSAAPPTDSEPQALISDLVTEISQHNSATVG